MSRFGITLLGAWNNSSRRTGFERREGNNRLPDECGLMSWVRLDCYNRDRRTKWERENSIIDLRTQVQNSSNFETKTFLNPHISKKPKAIFSNPKDFSVSERIPQQKSVRPLPAHLKFPQYSSFQRYKTPPTHWSIHLSVTPTFENQDNDLSDAVNALLALSDKLIKALPSKEITNRSNNLIKRELWPRQRRLFWSRKQKDKS